MGSERNRDKNILLFTGGFVIVVIACIIYTIFFTNDRKYMTEIGDLIFEETVFEVSNISRSDTKAKINLKELYMIGVEDEFNILIQDDKNNKIKANISKGKTREETEGGMILETEFIIIFPYPQDTDYVSFTITKGTDKKSFTIDIRDF